ncbi:MAG: TRAP transporter small permease [Fusobacteriaceae bacterium]
MKRLVNSIEKLQMSAGIIFISTFLITIISQIIFRYLEISAMWTEDIIKNSFIWAVFMGASVMVNHKAHFSFTSLADKLTGDKKIMHDIFVSAVMLIFTTATIYYGYIVTDKFWNYQWTNIPNFKMGWTWLCLPISGVTMTFYLISQIVENIKILKKGDK